MRKFNKILVVAIISIFSFNNCQNPSISAKSAIYSGVDQMVEAALNKVQTVTLDEFKSIFDAQEEMYMLVDVRTEGEFDYGYIPGSINIPRGLLEFWIEKESFWDEEGMYSPLKEDKIILYCKSGKRSALAAQTLQNMGFSNVYSLDGGFTKWESQFPDETQNNLPAVEPASGNKVAIPEAPGGC